MGSVLDGIIDRTDDVAGSALSFVVKDAQRHDFRVPGYAGYACRIIPFGSNKSRYDSAVLDVSRESFLEFRSGIGAAIHKVPAIDVVNKTVVIVVFAVFWDFVSVYPDIILQIGVRDVHAGVDYRHDAAAA